MAASSRTFVLPVLIGFGDCDPAGIVFYPNFFRWFDAASHAMMRAVDYDFQRVARTQGVIAGPLVDAGAKFLSPATHGETVEVRSQVVEWTTKTFRIAHRIVRGDTAIADGWEIRIFARADPDDPKRIRAVPVPDDFRRRFEAP